MQQNHGDRIPKILAILGLICFAAGCASAPPITVTTRHGQTGTSFENPDTTAVTTDACGETSPEAVFPITTDSVRGANVVFVLDDSGSMSGEISAVSSRMNAFIADLEQVTDQLKMILVFSMAGMNGSAFVPGQANPFQSIIDQGKALFVPESVGSRFADGALFKTFGLSTFVQRLPANIPVDAGGGTLASCSGAGKYFRPRHNQDNQSLTLVTSSCVSLPANPRSSATGNPDAPYSGPLGHLTPNVSINVVGFSDDDLNISGDFSANGNGLTLLKNTFDDIFAPLGAPAYYHSVVGLSNSGGIVRVGTQHRALASASLGSEDDLLAPNYDDVLDRLKLKIQFSEQVVTLGCQANAAQMQVYLDGELLVAASDYEYNSATREIRLLPTVFGPEDEAQTLTLRVVF